MRILVLGTTGMLGSTVFKLLSASNENEVWGTMRSATLRQQLSQPFPERLISGVDVLNHDVLVDVLSTVRPQVVINCVGLIKQHTEANNPLIVLPINAIFPHRLSGLCKLANIRLVHISTDCVFSGRKGNYVESDASDAEDLYGKSKYIGELHDDNNAITLRTSIIGHELESRHSLVDWFLGQQGMVKGYTKAIFSGLPTIELASVLMNKVLPNPELRGLYHVSAKPIAKFDLLELIATEYGKEIKVEPYDQFVINRSLNSDRFFAATGYHAPEWPELIRLMHQFH